MNTLWKVKVHILHLWHMYLNLSICLHLCGAHGWSYFFSSLIVQNYIMSQVHWPLENIWEMFLIDKAFAWLQNTLFSLLRLHVSNFVYTQELNTGVLTKLYVAKLHSNGVFSRLITFFLDLCLLEWDTSRQVPSHLTAGYQPYNGFKVYFPSNLTMQHKDQCKEFPGILKENITQRTLCECCFYTQNLSPSNDE